MNEIEVRTRDGRRLDVLVSGPAGGVPLLIHGGTPGGPVMWPGASAAVERAGFCAVGYGRPGYGKSDPRPGRSVADTADDVAAILDHLGATEFVSIGVSGGGPHVLASAALLPERCRAIVDVCGLAPYGAPGLDYAAGMSEANRSLAAASLAGRDAVAQIAAMFQTMVTGLDPASFAAMGATGLPEVDALAMTGELADFLFASSRKAFETGIAGFVDDQLGFVGDWGFDVSSIRCPMAVWHGALDRNVPQAHGRWVLAQVPHALARLPENHGHVSILTEMEAIVADLVELARQAS